MHLLRTTAFALSFVAAASMAFSGLDKSPKGTVEGLVKAWNSKDLASVSNRVVGTRPSPDLSDLFQALSQNAWPTITLSDIAIKESGDRATGTANATIEMPGGPQKIRDTFELRRSGGDWRVVPRANGDQRETVVSTIAQMVATAAAPAVRTEAELGALCRGHAGDLVMSAMMLTLDHGDVFKLDPARARASLEKFQSNPGAWTCPKDPSGTASYRFNARLAGKSIKKIKSPKTTVMFYEGSGGKLNFRHGGKATVGFVDGHTELVTPTQAKKLVW